MSSVDDTTAYQYRNWAIVPFITILNFWRCSMNHKLKPAFAAGIALGTGLLGMLCTPAFADDELSKLMQDDNQWAHPRKDYSNTGYSRLAQINKGNVKNLKLAWTF